MVDEHGNRLWGIRGREGAVGGREDGEELGVDLIEMAAGAEFPLHVHPGDHILIGHSGAGMVHVEGVDVPMRPGATVFIAASQPHGVRTYVSATDIHLRRARDEGGLGAEHALCLEPFRQSGGLFRFYAVGVPHEHVESADRMRLVDEDTAGRISAEIRRADSDG